ncbi:MAG: NAD(P)H-hydrate epimerase [Phaeodactylibacter sp.]|uniref:NAD(P)H-hydrate epimerase n=1 Tax=Phaeodactylibacter sp. TaxID=1940289 RepID=UPI0032ECFDBB
MSSIRVFRDEVPTLDVPQMIEVDRLMTEFYGITLLQMMENAGRCLAVLARDRFLDGNPQGKVVALLVGKGHNGGGALVAARRLINWGARVQIYLSHPPEALNSATAQQYQTLSAMGATFSPAEHLPERLEGELIIDGLIGYRLMGDPQGVIKNFIEWANRQTAPTLALDTPSGIELTAGQVHSPAIKARATLTLALPKKGLYEEAVQRYRGELYLGDISVPRVLYANPGLEIKVPDLFTESDVLRLP